MKQEESVRRILVFCFALLLAPSFSVADFIRHYSPGGGGGTWNGGPFASVATGPVGSAAAPTYSFTGDPNTGMFWSGPDELSFSLGNNARYVMRTTGFVLNGNFALVFEGATVDGTVTSVSATDPTGNNAIVFPDAGGTVHVSGSPSFTFGDSASKDPIVIAPVAKGAVSHTGTFTSEDLTGDVQWTMKNATGTVAFTSDITSGLADPGSNGPLVRTAPNVVTVRVPTSLDGSLIISNADGVAGAPDYSIDSAVRPVSSSGTGNVSGTGALGTHYFETDRPAIYHYVATDTPYWSLALAAGTGTSGGIPYFTATADKIGTSAALTANLPVIGGGAGAAPTVGTRSGNTTEYVTTTGTQTSGDCVKIDANGNHIANGSACGGGSSNFTMVSKNADETISSDQTLSDDAALTFAVSANTVYQFHLVVFWLSGATPDLQWKITCPASPTSSFFKEAVNDAGASSSYNLIRTCASSADTVNGGTDIGFIEYQGVVKNGSNAGAVTFQWAQNTSDASNSTVYEGSYIEYRVVP